MTAYLNWTCANCHTVNYITVEEKVAILKKLDPKFPVQDEIIKCRNCTSQVVVKAYVPPTLPSADDLDAVDQEEKIRHDTGR